MDYSFFDSLIDAVFVIDADRKVLYCNTAAANLCNSSVRRLSKGQAIYNIIHFNDQKLFTSPQGDWGRDEPSPFTEIEFKLASGDKSGNVQVAIQPFVEASGDKRWVVIVHDVTLEANLHAKYHGELQQKEDYIKQLREAKEKLEDYSKNLEQMVEVRTAEVKSANRMLSAIMNSLGQGFLVFDENGICSPIYTKACESILESSPKGMNIVDVLKLDKKAGDQFKLWSKASFDENLPFETMKDLAPQFYEHSKKWHITLDYFPLRDEDKKIRNLVLVATDKTAEYEANVALEKERHFAKMIIKLIRSKDQFLAFLKSAEEMINQAFLLIPPEGNENSFDYQQAFRLLHTIEGESGAFSAMEIRHSSRQAQESLEAFKWDLVENPKGEIKKYAQAISNLKDAYSSFLLDNRAIFELINLEKSKVLEIPEETVNEFARLLNERVKDPEILRWFTEEFLYRDLAGCFNHFNEVMRSIAEKQDKKVEPLIIHGTVRVDLRRLQPLLSSLVHAFRNSVDHGIETVEERRACGKREFGRMDVKLKKFEYMAANWIRIEIIDDGKGISPSVIRQKAIKKLPELDPQTMNDKDVIQLIFQPNFSSRDSVGEFSGRGVGMDAIKAEVERLGGRILVESELGKGTHLTIEFPETNMVSLSKTA